MKQKNRRELNPAASQTQTSYERVINVYNLKFDV